MGYPVGTPRYPGAPRGTQGYLGAGDPSNSLTPKFAYTAYLQVNPIGKNTFQADP